MVQLNWLLHLPPDFKSVSILFSQQFLQTYYSKHPTQTSTKPTWDTLQLNKHPFLTSLFDSILPYYELHGYQLPEHLTTIKLNEAMTILQKVNKRANNILANLAERDKIDLADFMQKNYSFNIPLERFAYLTGRSLATFKRDFQKHSTVRLKSGCLKHC